MADTVGCERLDGSIIQVEREKLVFRPAVYGIILKDEQILLVHLRATGRYHLPGGGIELGERMVDALAREVLEETGIQVEVGAFLHFSEIFFYYDPSGRAYHGLHYYYRCHPLGAEILTDDLVVDGSAEKPRWVDISSLKGVNLQADGDMIRSIIERAAHSV